MNLLFKQWELEWAVFSFSSSNSAIVMVVRLFLWCAFFILSSIFIHSIIKFEEWAGGKEQIVDKKKNKSYYL